MKRTLLNFARLGLFTVLALTTFSGIVFALNEGARFALHAKNRFTATKAIPNRCNNAADPSVPNYSPNWTNTPCSDYIVSRGLNEFPGADVFLVVGQASNIGVAGASVGINYHVGGSIGISETFSNWTSCTDGLEQPNDDGNGDWPNPGGGLRITWSTCQNQEVGGRGVHAVLGVFYIYAYSDDVLELTPNNNQSTGPELGITACAGGTTNLLDIIAPSLIPAVLGRVQFGNGRDGLTGYSPCNDILPARETTWGNIKTLYKQEN